MSITLNAGSGGAALNTDNVAGVETQVAKLAHGAAGSATLVSTASGLPVQQQGAWTVGLPAGASTAAKQPALGTAGSASADVLSVQGVASMTALKTDGSGVTQPVSGTFWQATQPVSGTFWQATQPVSNAGTFAVQAAVADGASVTLGAKADAKSTATDVTAVSAMSVLKQISASVQAPPSQAVTNAGTFATQAAATEADGANVTLGAKADAKSTATDTTAVTAMSVLKQISASVQAPPSQAVTNAGTFAVQAAATIADGADTTFGAKGDAKSTATDTTSISAMSVLKQISASVQAPPSQAVTNAGTFAVQSAQSGTWTVQPGNTANTTPWLVSAQAPTAGGWTPAKLISAATTNATNVKASAGQLGYATVMNLNAAARYLKLYDKASAPTVGTDVPKHVFLIPGNTAGAGAVVSFGDAGAAFALGIGFALTTGIADADTGAVAANEIVVNYGWK